MIVRLQLLILLRWTFEQPVPLPIDPDQTCRPSTSACKSFPLAGFGLRILATEHFLAHRILVPTFERRDMRFLTGLFTPPPFLSMYSIQHPPTPISLTPFNGLSFVI